MSTRKHKGIGILELSFILLVLGGILALSSTVIGISELLRARGFASVFEAVELEGELKVSVALYAAMAGFAFAFSLIGVYLVRKNFSRSGGLSGLVAAAFGFSTFLVPQLQGLEVTQTSMYGAASGSILLGIGGVIGLWFSPAEEIPGSFVTPMQISFTAIFSAMTAVLTGLTGAVFPSPTGGYTHIGDSVIYLSALILGPKVGVLTGIIGPVAADLYVGYSRWFVTVLAHGFQGLAAGFGKDRHIGIQAIFCGLGGVLMAVTYFYVNIFIKGYPVAVLSLFRDLFGQTAVSLIIAMLLIKPLERIMRIFGR